MICIFIIPIEGGAGYWVLGAGYWVLGAGYWVLGVLVDFDPFLFFLWVVILSWWDFMVS